MFPHNPPAVTVTKKDVYFPGKDPSVVYFFHPYYADYLPGMGYEEDEIIVLDDNFKFRHPNRIQTISSKKTRRIIEMNFDLKKDRNRREHHHRSKERKLMQKVA